MKAIIGRIGSRPGYGIELVIAHRRPGETSIDHSTDNSECAKLTGATIDEVANEYSGSAGVPPGAFAVLIAKLGEQRFQLVCVSVYITNDILAHSLVPETVTADIGYDLGFCAEQPVAQLSGPTS